MKIGNRTISKHYPPLVIAEIGINHGGDLDLAKNMALKASRSGCEIIKHQTHFVDDEMTEDAKYIVPPNSNKSIWEIMDECSLTKDEEIQLKKYAEELGMIYISTPFSRSAADFLHEIGVEAFKIGSGESDNLLLIRHIASFKKPVILSTGMQTVESIRKSVSILENAEIDYSLLECTNLYPSPPEIVSLKGILELQNAFPNAIIGFSDHSIGPEMALAGVALGACIIERHFTDTRYREGPDISCSMDPLELSYIIDRSREIHKALINPKSRTKPEEDVYRFARSSIVSDRDLAAGKVIELEDIWARRPGNGQIPGFDFEKVIGQKLKMAKKKNQQLNWVDFE